ncbi:MAG TPA: hypothetical protein VG938_20615 [Verrucomicrobiae bacterium]|jgi:hypothetical protein|nr:hypothetical protein [Verrucomicrobiae bacterium]
MSKLNRAIAEWRRKMSGAGIKSPVVLDELEDHLREDVEGQIRSSADVEQAFNRAVERIGKSDRLVEEFRKVAKVRTRARTLLRRWSVVAGIVFVYSALAVSWFAGLREGKIELTWTEIALALGAIAPMILLNRAGPQVAKLLPVIHENWIIVLTFVALFAGAALMKMFIEGLSPANLVQVQVIALWSLSPTIGFGSCVAAWHDRALAARKEMVNP